MSDIDEERPDDRDGDAAATRQPGVSALRSAVAAMAEKAKPSGGGASLGRDAIAGLTVTVGSVPSAMANGLLAGVNPIYGLYGNMAGMTVGGALASSQLMVINTTGAAALVAGQSLTSVPSEDRAGALFLMVLLAGVLQVVLGLLKAGRLLRFISFSVMTGFVAGIAVVLVLSQLPTATGVDAEGGNEVTQTFDLLGSLGQVHLPTVVVAVLALLLAALLPRTPLQRVASLLAIIVPTVVVVLVGLDAVETVSDVGEIPAGIPLPAMPRFSMLSPELLGGAFAVAVVSLIQSAGVSQSLPRSAGSSPSMSRDFVAQGAGNIAAGLVRGLPVGGSLSATALNVSAGAQRRWATIFGGIWTVVLVAAFSGLVGHVAMPALAALLLYAASKSISPGDVTAVWHAGWPSVVGALTTFVCTLLLPMQLAVLIGIALAALLYVAESSTSVSVVALVERPDGQVEEQPPPDRLPDRQITVLHVYGNLFYAGARTLGNRLPKPGADRPVVVLRLRGHGSLGATAVDVLSGYARRLSGAGGQLYLTGLSESARTHLVRSEQFRSADDVELLEQTKVLGESTRRAVDEASEWLLRHEDHSASKDPRAGD